MPVKKWRFYGIKAGLLPVPGCAFFLNTDGLAGLHHLHVAPAAVDSEVMRKDLSIGLSHNLGFFETHKLFIGLIDQHVPALNVLEINDIGDSIYQGMVMGRQLSENVIRGLFTLCFFLVLHDAS